MTVRNHFGQEMSYTYVSPDNKAFIRTTSDFEEHLVKDLNRNFDVQKRNMRILAAIASLIAIAMIIVLGAAFATSNLWLFVVSTVLGQSLSMGAIFLKTSDFDPYSFHSRLLDGIKAFRIYRDNHNNERYPDNRIFLEQRQWEYVKDFQTTYESTLKNNLNSCFKESPKTSPMSQLALSYL